MNPDLFASTAKGMFTTFGQAAHQAVGVYREAGERLGTIAGERWTTAYKQSSPKLSAETRKNATHAKNVFGGYYAKGLAMSADGAEVAIDTIVGAGIAAVERAAKFQHTFAHKTA